jgi:hypothetical protein
MKRLMLSLLWNRIKNHVGAAWENLKAELLGKYVCSGVNHRKRYKSLSSPAFLLSLHHSFRLLQNTMDGSSMTSFWLSPLEMKNEIPILYLQWFQNKYKAKE